MIKSCTLSWISQPGALRTEGIVKSERQVSENKYANFFPSVKINKWKPGLEWLCGQQGELYCPTTHTNYSSKGTRLLCKANYCTSQQEDRLPHHAPQHSGWVCHNPTKANLPHFQFPVYANGLSVYNSLPNFFLSSRKSVLCSGTCLHFWCSLLVPDCTSLLFLNKPIFGGKITGSLFFEVNTPYGSWLYQFLPWSPKPIDSRFWHSKTLL